MNKKTIPRECEMPGGDCYEFMDVGCDYHGQDALNNKTGYYAEEIIPKRSTDEQ